MKIENMFSEAPNFLLYKKHFCFCDKNMRYKLS